MRVFSIIALAALCLTGHAWSVPALGVNASEVDPINVKVSHVAGYEFRTEQPITISQVGLRDFVNAARFGSGWPVPVWIWNEQGRVVLRGEIPVSAKLADGVYSAEVEPTTLPAGTYFIGAMQRLGSKQFGLAKKAEAAPGITVLGGRSQESDVMVLPKTVASAPVIGPVFRFSPDATGRPLPSADLQIDSPTERAVFQRDDKNGASIPLQVTAANGLSDVRYRVLDQKSKAVTQDWQPFATSAAVRIPAGWYTLEVSAKNATGESVTASVERFGVGEVFLTAGQSNSANYGAPRQKPSDDRVSAFDWETGLWRHADDPQPGAAGDGGSAWPALGDAISAKYNVPVGIVSMGIGSTRVLQWIPTRPGTFFNRIAIALTRLKPFGARAFLWHQGESDAINSTTPSEYFEMLKSIVDESRKVAGYPLPWGVALASFHPDVKATAQNQAQIVEGQKRVIAEVPGVFQGADTNTFHERSLLYGGVHFNEAGLKEHGRLWAVALEPILPKP